ncbi:acyltransferase family protein [Mesorhizobium sp. ES1-3]|uniref:acyltransferase family protein n=1 Tax=Mesorhizobium sp. ES1-3 TaxID=2876628 RepID=UPI001CCB82B2|nr:acyltransferase family protein [Mesorhizobium sp. ES1-3]MBZ9669565.1 acyltransferase family protein [Mesorhizobium sp. ES1-3]
MEANPFDQTERALREPVVPGHVGRTPAPDQRIVWVDICRGFGIILVVVAHIFIVSHDPVKQYMAWGIFLFHMPLFFILSGYFYSPSSTSELARKRSQSLLLPYVGFLATLVVLDVIWTYARGQTLAPWQFREIAIHSVLGGQFLDGKFGTFWFVTCLFLTQLAYNFVGARSQSALSPAVLTLVACSCALGYLVMHEFPAARTPWAISCIPIAMVAFWFGHMLAQRPSLGQFSITFLSGAFVICTVAAIAGVHFSFSMKDTNFGPPLLGILLATALSVAVMLTTMKLSNWPPAEWLIPVGRASLVIMFVHQFVHFTLRDLGVSRDLELILAAVIVPFALCLVMDRFWFSRWMFLGKARKPIPGNKLANAA